MAATYHGKGGKCYVGASSSAAATSIVKLTDWSIDMPKDFADASGMGELQKTYKGGQKDLKIKFSGLWDTADDTLFDAADSDTAVPVYIYPAEGASGKYFYGHAWLDISITGGKGDMVKISANGVADDAWDRQ